MIKKFLPALFLLLLAIPLASAEDIWVDESWEHISQSYDCDGLSLVFDAEVLCVTDGTTGREYHVDLMDEDFQHKIGQESDWSVLGFDSDKQTWREPTKAFPEFTYIPQDGTVYPSVSIGTICELHIHMFNSSYTSYGMDHWLYASESPEVDSAFSDTLTAAAKEMAAICGYQIGGMTRLYQVSDTETLQNLITTANQLGSENYRLDENDAASYAFADACFSVYYNGLRLYSGAYCSTTDGIEVRNMDLRVQVTAGHGIAYIQSVLLDLSKVTPTSEEQPVISREEIIDCIVEDYSSLLLLGTKQITVKQMSLEYVPMTGDETSSQGFTLYPAWVLRYEMEEEDGTVMQGFYSGYSAITGKRLF